MIRTPLAAGAVLAAALATAPAPAHALFPACFDAYSFMLICCPKPCPILDLKALASRVMHSILRRQELAQHEAQAEQSAALVQVLGAPGMRSLPTHQCPGDAPLGDDAPNPDAQSETMALPADERHSNENALLLATLLDTARITERSALAIDASDGAAERSAQALQSARDVRDIARIAAVLRIEREAIERATDAMHQAQLRLHAARELVVKTRDPVGASTLSE